MNDDSILPLREWSNSALTTEVINLRQKLGEMAVMLEGLRPRIIPARTPEVWYYDVRFPLEVENLYPAEYWDHRVKRWVGPKPIFGLNIALEAGLSYNAEIEVYDFITREAYDSFEIIQDGMPIKWSLVKDRHYEAIIVPATGGLTRLEFACGVAVSPRELNSESLDERMLSFSFTYIRISPMPTKYPCRDI